MVQVLHARRRRYPSVSLPAHQARRAFPCAEDLPIPGVCERLQQPAGGDPLGGESLASSERRSPLAVASGSSLDQEQDDVTNGLLMESDELLGGLPEALFLAALILASVRGGRPRLWSRAGVVCNGVNMANKRSTNALGARQITLLG